MSKVLLCFERIIVHQTLKWDVFAFSSWRRACLGARQTTQRALVLLSCSVGSLMVWWFSSSTSPRHQRTGGGGGPGGMFAFIQPCVSQPNAMATGPMGEGKTRGSIVSCAAACKRQATLWFLEYFLHFTPVKATESEKMNGIRGSYWLLRAYCTSTDIWMFCMLTKWDNILLLVWVDVCRLNMGINRFSLSIL